MHGGETREEGEEEEEAVAATEATAIVGSGCSIYHMTLLPQTQLKFVIHPSPNPNPKPQSKSKP